MWGQLHCHPEQSEGDGANVSVTNDLERRLAEHKAGLSRGYGYERGINRLVHFEMTTDILAAISREKQVKAWTRAKRLALIEQANPEWRDLTKS